MKMNKIVALKVSEMPKIQANAELDVCPGIITFIPKKLEIKVGTYNTIVINVSVLIILFMLLLMILA